MVECASETRPPPSLPLHMAAELEHKSFFSSADRPSVAQLYETFLDNVAPNQTWLGLSGLGWGAEEATVLAAALPRFERLVELNLNRNQIGNEGCKALSEALRVHGSITVLEMTNNLIGDEGAMSIAVALSENTSKISTLDLVENCISDEGAKALATLCAASKSLTFLNISNNELSYEGKCALEDFESGFELVLSGGSRF
mgnify:FL=1